MSVRKLYVYQDYDVNISSLVHESSSHTKVVSRLISS